MLSRVDGLFAGGDAEIAQPLIVWTIGRGHDAARHVDTYLTSDADLPVGLETDNEAIVSI
ncbi:MAG: hypothetical protein ABEJ58_07050 [Halodesulfurarchaeum sp.]